MEENQQDIIRVKVMCLFAHDGKVLVGRGYEVATGEHFYRVLGGSLNFGESTEEGIRREMREELKCEVENLRLCEVLENRYTYEGRKGHEVVFLYQGDLADKSLYAQNPIHIIEDTYKFYADWIRISEILSGTKKLYPTCDYKKYLKQT